MFQLSLAWRAIRAAGTRSVLTVLIIGIGITALVGILTAFEILKRSVTTSFSSLGANTFQITGDEARPRKRRGNFALATAVQPIRWAEAVQFKRRFLLPATVSISTTATGSATARRGSKKTNPNVRVMGVDEAYFTVADTRIPEGRAFSRAEGERGDAVCVLGAGIRKKLFKGTAGGAVNGVVFVGGRRYRIIGVAEPKGGSMLMDADNVVFLPVRTARAAYGAADFVISVAVPDVQRRAYAAGEAEGLMRTIRRVPTGDPADFQVVQSDELAKSLLESIRYVLVAAVLIGVITMLGSVIGLTNILLVAVAERTREIGVAKALGAPARSVRRQFLAEALLISGLGGTLGVVLGLVVGNLVALAFKAPFIVPWGWMGLGLLLCAITGLVAGLYPALKAARVAPIVALRYE